MGTFSATFTLTAGSSANVGGFNITGNPGSVSIATGVSRTALAAGVSYSVDDAITEFIIASTGDCTNSVTKFVSGGPTPTPTTTPTGPTAQFSLSSGSNTRSGAGTGSSTYSPIITVTNGPVTIRLTAAVQTGYQADSTIVIPGVGTYSPTAAQGAGNSSFIEFTLATGVYNCDWTVNAISDGAFTVATASLTQV